MLSPAQFVNSFLPTEQDVIDTVSAHDGSITRALVARLFHTDFTPFILPNPPIPADPSNISPYVDDDQVKFGHNTQEDVHDTVSFRLHQDVGLDQFNTLTVLIQLSYQYWNASPEVGGVPILEVSQGLFEFTIPDRTIQDSGDWLDITGSSVVQRLADLGFACTFTVPANFNVIDAVIAMLRMDDLPPDQGGRQPLNPPTFPPPLDPNNPTNLPAVGYGSGRGYCKPGYAVNDPALGLGGVVGQSNLFAAAPEGLSTGVSYLANGSLKLDPRTLVPIDPVDCQLMRIWQNSPDPTRYPFLTSTGYVLDLATNTFLTQALDAGQPGPYGQVNPVTGDPLVGLTPTALQLLGGDGGASGAAAPAGPATGAGSGLGYCPSGWAVGNATYTGMTPLAPGSNKYTMPVTGLGSVTYLGFIGLKVDSSGHPIDPWTCEPMAAITGGQYGFGAGTPDVFKTSQTVTIGPTTYTVGFQPTTGNFLINTGQWVDPSAGFATTTQGPTQYFQQHGGDGGILKDGGIGQVGPQGTGCVGAYCWPDPNNPGMAPNGCSTPGPNWPADKIRIPPSPVLTTTTVKFDPKTNFLAAINQLLAMANYWPITADRDGNLVSGPQPFTIGGSRPTPSWIYRTGQGTEDTSGYSAPVTIAIKPPVLQKINDKTPQSLANFVVVRCENNKAAPLEAVAYNLSPDSFVSILNLGRVIQKQPIIQLDNITDLSILQDRAFIEINLAALGAEVVTVEVPFNPFMEAHDCIGLFVYSPDGQTLKIDSTTQPYLVTARDHDLKNGTTKITAGRLVAL